MLIALNGQKILIDNPAGPEKYTINVFSALAKVDTTNDYVVYFSQEPTPEFWKELSNNNPKWKYKVLPTIISWMQISIVKEFVANTPDVFFTATHSLPVLLTLCPIKLMKTKFVVMLHGLEFTFAKKNANWFRRMGLGWTEWYCSLFSTKLIVPTQAIKDEVVKRRWTHKNKIYVVNEGVSNFFYKRSENEISAATYTYNLIDTTYLIFVSTIQPRKNLPKTIEAFAKVLAENQNLKNVKLAIVGKTGWAAEESLTAPKKYGVENNVMFLGRVPDKDLPALISGAKGYINFSLEEGFGLPLLEAMACEIPCAVSNILSLQEVGGDIPLYADPKNVMEMATSMHQLLTKNKDTTKVTAGKQRTQLFSWENTALRTLAVILASLDGKQQAL